MDVQREIRQCKMIDIASHFIPGFHTSRRISFFLNIPYFTSYYHSLIVYLNLSHLHNASFGIGRIQQTAKFITMLRTPMIHIAM